MMDVRLSDGSLYSFSNSSSTPKSILSDRSSSSWRGLFPRRKKNVKFSELQVSRSGNGYKVEEKWKKYVADQFRALHKRRQKRDRWLGRGVKSKTRPHSASTANKISINSDGQSGPSTPHHPDDDMTSGDVLETIEVPEPDHKKRKKSPATCRRTKNKKRKKKTRKQKLAETKPIVPGDGDPTTSSLPEEAQEAPLKRPMNAFLVFSRCCREQFRDLMMPIFSSRVTSMVLGHVWRFMSKEERRIFYQEAEQLQEAYLEEKKERTVTKEKELKRPLNAFMLFCQDQRAQFQNRAISMSGRQAINKMAAKWKKLKRSQKQEYLERADKERTTFNQQLYGQENRLSFLTGNKEKTEDEEGNWKGDGAMKTAVSQLKKKFGKNNNKWFTDSSDTEESPANSTTEMKPVRDSAVSDSPLACLPSPHSSFYPPDVSTKPASTDNQGPEQDSDSEGESDVDEADEEDVKGTSPTQRPAAASSSYSSVASDRSESHNYAIHSRKRRRRKKSRKKRRYMRSRQWKNVHWKDELYPWDTFNPVACVLCDEDICTRLCQPPVVPDDCLFRSASAGLYRPLPSCPCLACGSPSVRQSISCVSFNTRRRQVEAAFRKSEVDLATFSSSASSGCDACPYAYNPPTVPSSSDESGLSQRFQRVHLSNQEETRRADVAHSSSAAPLICQTSHIARNSSQSARPSQSNVEQTRLHLVDPNECRSDSKKVGFPGMSNQSKASYRPLQPGDADSVRKSCAGKTTQPKCLKPHHTESKYMKRSHSSADSNCNSVNCSETPTALEHSSWQIQIDSKAKRLGLSAGLYNAQAKKMLSKTLMDRTTSSAQIQLKPAPFFDEGKGLSHQDKNKQEFYEIFGRDAFNSSLLAPRELLDDTNSHSIPKTLTGQKQYPCTEEEDTKLERLNFKVAEETTSYKCPYHHLHSAVVAGLHHLPSSTADASLEPRCSADGLVCAETSQLTSHANTDDRRRFSEGLRQGGKRSLKRKVSHDSPEAVDDGLDKCSHSQHLACSLFNSSLAVDKSCRSKLSGSCKNTHNISQFGDDLLDSQGSSPKRKMFDFFIPTDLELEYCTIKKWIL